MIEKQTVCRAEDQWTNKIYCGDVLSTMKTLPDNTVDCVVTSPPYWQLRDYGFREQWGLEPTYQEYLEHLWQFMDEVKRVLKKTGTAWINLGDTYGTISGAMRDGKFGIKNTNNQSFTQPKSLNKCLLLIPHRFAIGCIDRGWVLRNDIIWAKRNGMPESVTDRFSKKHEYFFMMCKSKVTPRWENIKIYDAEKWELSWLAAMVDGEGCFGVAKNGKGFQNRLMVANTYKGIIDRCYEITGLGHIQQRKEGIYYWSVSGDMAAAVTKAIYPYLIQKTEQAKVGLRLSELNQYRGSAARQIFQQTINEKRSLFTLNKRLNQRQIINSGMDEPDLTVLSKYVGCEDYYFDLDGIRDRSTTKDNIIRDRDSTKLNNTPGRTIMGGLKTNDYLSKNPGTVSDFWDVTTKGTSAKHYASFNFKLIEKCIVAGCPEGGIILDPFCGTGTTLVRALQLNRKVIGIDGSKEYCDIAQKNIDVDLNQTKLF